jgi:hypothetical protein
MRNPRETLINAVPVRCRVRTLVSGVSPLKNHVFQRTILQKYPKNYMCYFCNQTPEEKRTDNETGISSEEAGREA